MALIFPHPPRKEKNQRQLGELRRLIGPAPHAEPARRTLGHVTHMRDQAKHEQEASEADDPRRPSQQLLVIVDREEDARYAAEREPHELLAQVAIDTGHVARCKHGTRAGKHHQAQGDKPEHDDEQQVSDISLHEQGRILL